MTSKKIDLKKEDKALYRPSSKAFAVVEVPEQLFLMVDGQGDPGGPAFGQAVEGLYSVAYGVKFLSKKEPGIDFVVMPLEGLWWAEDMSDFDPQEGDRDQWLWRAMVRQPGHMTAEMVAEGVAKARAKGKGGDFVEEIRLEWFAEGLAAQIMHLGPFSEEGPTIRRLHQEFLPENGLVENGRHHEIYLSDIRRTAPEKLRTVLRQPVEEKDEG
jgi:hypothetical protein